MSGRKMENTIFVRRTRQTRIFTFPPSHDAEGYLAAVSLGNKLLRCGGKQEWRAVNSGIVPNRRLPQRKKEIPKHL